VHTERVKNGKIYTIIHTHRHTHTHTHTHRHTPTDTRTQTGTIIHAVAPVKPMRLGDTEIEKDKIGTAIA
jgi:hypothetical protein